MLSFTVGNEKYSCQVIRTSRKRSIGIEVSPYRGVVVHAPRKLNDLRILQLLEGNANWIERRLELLRVTTIKLRSFSTGDQFLFLGQWLRLEVLQDAIAEVRVNRSGSCLAVHVPQEAGQGRPHGLVKDGLIEWYRDRTTDVLTERVALYAPLVGVAIPLMRVNNARKRWGSCGVNGRLNFPWRLVMAPLSLVDYVVVHELCHLLQRDHSAAYWNLVAAVLPDYRERRQRLRMEGPYFDL